jgi:hypothetical protein
MVAIRPFDREKLMVKIGTSILRKIIEHRKAQAARDVYKLWSCPQTCGQKHRLRNRSLIHITFTTFITRRCL